MLEYHLRSATDADLPTIADIQRRAGQLELAGVDENIRFDGPSLEEAIGALAPDVRLAERDGQVLGFVAVSAPQILWLYVDPDHHRRGVGRALIRAACDLCGPDAYLEMLGSNAAALSFYQAQGFAIVCRGTVNVPGVGRNLENLHLSLAD